MTLTGGQFMLTAKPGCPGVWMIEWKNAEGVVTGPVEARLDDAGGNPRSADAFWKECENADEVELEVLGEELWRFLMSGKHGAAWSEARNAAGNVPVWRTGLDFGNTGLEAFPWEMMKNPEELQHAGFHDSITFCRMGAGVKCEKLADGWPWRILILKGCADEAKGIQTGAEVEAIHRAWWPLRHEVAIMEVFPKGQEELSTLILNFAPHILHFMGHAKPGILEFTPPGAGGWNWSAKHIELCYKPTPPPLVVWLNACQTAATRTEQERTHVSLQQLFTKIGVPAVIGVRGNIDGGLAVEQAAKFYENLATGKSVDAALAVARTAAELWRSDASRKQSITLHQPFLTALTLSGGMEKVLQIPPACAAYQRIRQDTPLLRKVDRWFVDRNSTRADIFGDMLDSTAQVKPDRPSRLVVLHGDELTGKTWALHSILAALASRGWVVRAHCMNGQKSMDWLEILNLVRHGQDKPAGADEKSELLAPLDRGLPGAPFARFDKVAAQPGAEPKVVFDEFIKGLGACGQPVAIALDQIRTVPGETVRPPWLDLWETHFFKELGQGRGGPVIGFAVMDQDRLKDSQINQKEWTREVGVVAVAEIQLAYRRLSEELLGPLLHSDPNIQEVLDFYVATLAKLQSGLTPAALLEMYQGMIPLAAAKSGKAIPKPDLR